MPLLSTWLAAATIAAPGAPSAAHPPIDPAAQEPPCCASTPVLLRASRIIVRPGEVLKDAAVLVVDGRIEKVAPGLAAPEGAEVIEGEVICAGFLDPWSSLGVTRDCVLDGRADAASRTADGFDPHGSAYTREEALAAGVVAVRAQGGTRSDLAGVGAWFSTGPGDKACGLVLVDDACVGARVGISERGKVDVFDRIDQVDKLVNKLRSGWDYSIDQTEYRHAMQEWREKIAKEEAKLEKDFKKAKKAREKAIEEAEEKDKEHKEKSYKEDKPPKPPKYDAEKEVLARLANGEMPLVVEMHRVAELREFLALTRGLDRLRIVIAGGTEAEAVAEELARRRIPVIVHPAPLGESRPDHLAAHDLALAASLAEAGVPVLLGSGGGAAARDLPLLATLAIGHGLDPEEAFAALTYRAARVLDVADCLGSVQAGRRADLLVLDGDPLAVTTRVRHVLVGGRVVVSPTNQNGK